MHPTLPGQFPSRSGDSIPSTSESARVFALESDAIDCFQRLAHIGEKEQWLLRREDLNVGSAHLLGEGGFGQVYAVLYQGAFAAMKVPKEHMNISHLGSICNELRILRKLRHPNIVSLYGACVDEVKGSLMLVLERVTGVTLRQFVTGKRGGSQSTPSMQDYPSEESRVQIIVGVSSALCHLHSVRPLVVHGDLKPSNVLVVYEYACAHFKAKLLDFGLARALTKHANPLGGTPLWAAPEVFHGAKPSAAADVFSFGRLLFLMVTSLNLSGCTEESGALQDMQPHNALEMLAGSGLAGKSRSLIEQCSSSAIAMRPSMRKVYSEVSGWMEALTECCCAHETEGVKRNSPSSLVALDQRDSIAGPLSTSLTTDARRSAGQADGALADTRFRPTPAARVKALVTDLLLCCNLEVDEGACCFFHGALASLGVSCENGGPRQSSRPADLPAAQCAHYGALAQGHAASAPDGSIGSGRCRCCADPLVSTAASMVPRRPHGRGAHCTAGSRAASTS